MKLGYAILADAAEVSSEGKLMLMGGNIDTINASAFPLVYPRLSLVVNLLIEPSDLSEANSEEHVAPLREWASGTPLHEFRVECAEPDETTLVFAGVVPIPLSDIPKHTDLPPKYLFVLALPPLVFRATGVYTFRLYWDDQLLGNAPVLLRQVQPDQEQTGTASSEKVVSEE